MEVKNAKKKNYCQNFSYIIIENIEKFFYRFGLLVANNPLKFILICIIFMILSLFGFLRFHQEKNPMKLWLPSKSSFLDQTDWLMNTFQKAYRPEEMIITATDVLKPEVFSELLDVMNKVENVVSSNGYILHDVCFKIPDLDMDVDFIKKFTPDHFDESYCKFVQTLGENCYIKNILDLWNSNGRKINALTKEDIIDKLNRNLAHPVFGNMKNYEQMLSGINRNESGYIISAKAIQVSWMIMVNFTAVDIDKTGNAGGTSDFATEDTLDWESAFLKLMKTISKNTKNFNLTYASSRSFGDISSASMFEDLDILAVGTFIMIIYVQCVISKLNMIEARVVLGFAGLINIGMAFMSAVGLCSLLGISYGPVHTSLPFLLMGLGVDDMFVLVACWQELKDEQKKLSLPVKIALTLKHSGVSITVTSLTDVVAFAVGSFTVLPCLHSYCLYAGVGVLITYLFVITFFTACLTLDQRRIDDNRNGIIPCIKHKNVKKSETDRISKRLFQIIYSRLIFTWPGKLFVILVTAICLGISGKSIFKLEQRFDPRWFISADSHLNKYLLDKDTYYPTFGFETGIYIGNINYAKEINKVKDISDKLNNSTDIINDIISWVDPFYEYVDMTYKKDLQNDVISEEDFNKYLSTFLFSKYGSKFASNFRLKNDLKCGLPASDIMLSIINFRFNSFNGPKEHLPAMRRIRSIADNSNFTTGDRISIAWSKIFSTWITDEVIDVEVIRNIELALLCVMVCTLLLIGDIHMCFLIFICVVFTMINVMGFMQIWGLTIDLVTCIALQLALGLCVDYASHIGHTFLTITEGTNSERSLKSVTSIGSAVLAGGISTFIGVCMLGFSDSYSFKTFFKIFFLVVLFGLYHGIVFLPVLLCWLGPKPYRFYKTVKQNDIELS